MNFIDAHCHLGSRQFDHDREETVERMLETGVRKAILICCNPHDLFHSVSLRQKHPGFRLAAAIHPQDLEEYHEPDRLDRLKEALIENQADMIGETGLDYYSHPHTKEAQKRFFIAQLQMAEELHLPVDIHSRKASADTLAILKSYPARGIIHSYSGSYEMAELFMKLGYYISFGSSVLFKGSKKPAQVISRMPLDRLLIETDAPYQSPIRDHRHEPSDVIAIYEAIAEIRNMTMEELAKIIEYNFDQVFDHS